MTTLYSDKYFIMTVATCHYTVRWTHYLVTTLYSDKASLVTTLLDIFMFITKLLLSIDLIFFMFITKSLLLNFLTKFSHYLVTTLYSDKASLVTTLLQLT